MVKISSADNKFHRTILFQLDGLTFEKQTKKMGLKKPVSIPMLKFIWRDERIKIKRKVLKATSTVGDKLFEKSSWEKHRARFGKKVGFQKQNRNTDK